MNNDLIEIEKVIRERKQSKLSAESEETPAVPATQFNKSLPEQTKDVTTELVENAFSQAIVHTVATDENVQAELFNNAGKVIKNKTNAIKERVDLEEKEAYFNNRKGACECFGYDEATTEKWAVKFMNIWHNVMTAIWIFFGCFTFAPITFVAKKIRVIFKKAWIAVTLAIIIYLIVVVGIPLLTGFMNK